ncbi:MAG: phosphoribosylanthranilate isomerase, partial [Chloroflexota bacterium]
MNIRVKICGITTLEDGLMASRAGADLLGLNFFPKSPRYLTPDAARDLCDALRAELGAACPVLVGVFVNEIVSHVSITMEKVGLNFAQLSGDESGEMLRELRGIGFKAIRPRSMQEALDDAAYFGQFAPTDERAPSLLLDAYNPQLYGGTGEQASAEVANAVREKTPRL